MTSSDQGEAKKPDSKFRFVLLAAQRAEDMINGARAKIDQSGLRATRLAMREIHEGYVDWGYGAAPETAAPAEGGEEPAAADN
jgi:DNA-directed RNA polymerase subunit K/omega